MLNKYNKIREDIRKTIYQKPYDYEKCIRLSKQYLSALKNESTQEDLEYDLLIANYYLGLGYKKLSQYKSALKYALKALKYTKPFELDYNHIMTKWLIAETKYELGDLEYSIKTFQECKEMFQKLNQKRYEVCMLYNIYRIQKDDDCMLQLIKEYESHLLNEDGSQYTYLDEAQKDSLLQDMYNELADIYIMKNKTNDIYKILKNIKNEELKNLISKKLIA